MTDHTPLPDDNHQATGSGEVRASENAEQHLRFERAGEDLDLISDLDDDTPWTEARAVLAERKRGASAGQSYPR